MIKNKERVFINMIIITNTKEREQYIRTSFKRLMNNCAKQIKDEVDRIPLIISDELSVNNIYNDEYGIFKKAYSGGLGAMKGNILYEAKLMHLVVLNFDNIDKIQLSDDEFDGVLAHELGHVFNENPKRAMPSFLMGNTVDEVNAAKELSMNEAEFYADYFAKMTNTAAGLLGSMEKYLSSDISLNVEMFKERIKNLNSKKKYIGNIKNINTIA